MTTSSARLTRCPAYAPVDSDLMSKIRVAVVFGGRNSEHAVSLMGAGSVLEVIDRARYEIIPIGIAPDGRWVLAAPDQSYAIENGALPVVADTGAALALPSEGGL